MITELNIDVPEEYLQQALSSVPSVESKLTINQPTGNFFYDPWTIKSEFSDTVWAKILNTLPGPVGEARLISLGIERCYTKHADIDNRWHYSLTNDDSYLIDVNAKRMYSLFPGVWHYMDAGRPHTAVNLGCNNRMSLVVRELLPKNVLVNPRHVIITVDTEVYNHRFLFDENYSALLNRWQTSGALANFELSKNVVKFDLEKAISLPAHQGVQIEEYDCN